MRNKERGGTIFGIFIGLVLGVAAAAAVIWYVNKIPVPFAEKEQIARLDNSRAPINLPGKPGDVANSAPAGKVAAGVPTGDASAPGNTSLPEVTPPAPVKQHYLQAGSFSNPDEADNLKAKLAMQGIEASVRQVILQDKTYFRLMLGPFEKMADAKESRAELARLGVETLILQE